ncbi:MAG: diaminopimelate epimerase [Bacteroidota bacterium]|nr:diaminopimelate epimerase [Bacteroidota bacterium]
MKIDFFKYQGTGNDFIIIDNRGLEYNLSKKQVAYLCNRRFGIGADGLMLLENHDNLDFEMRYFNADGAEASLCGNGGRCMVAFAKMQGLFTNSTKFMAVDGVHEASINKKGIVDLKMLDVTTIRKTLNGYYLNTGSPHYVTFVDNADILDVFVEGRNIRYHKEFSPDGCNVNFVDEIETGIIKVYTYERGVENETLSCGTGVVAAAISSYIKNRPSTDNFSVQTKGGNLSVKFSCTETKKASQNKNLLFTNIWLSGPAEFVFSGYIKLNQTISTTNPIAIG